MNDPNLDPIHELASAFLDGELPPHERAQAEASTEVQAVVESFRSLRSELADVPPVAEPVRAAAFAAAFAELDAPTHAPVVPIRARRRWNTQVISAAAAVLLVGIVGVAAFGSRGNDDSSKSNASTEERMTDMATDADGEAPAGGSPEAAPSTIGSVFTGGDVAVVIESTEELLALQPPADADATQYTVPTDSGGAPTTATELTVAPTLPRTALACLTEQQVFLADIVYEDQYAIAARDTVTGVTVVIDDDCTVLVSVGP